MTSHRSPKHRKTKADIRLRIEDMLLEEHGELKRLDQEVAASIAQRDTISANTSEAYVGQRTIGEAIADAIAAFGGSWTFILSFICFLILWIIVNIIQLTGAAFDPYPFILLNLILSCLAALQAPIIMMSQNRQEAKDRLRSENDYQINLKAELEIRLLHDKLDHLVTLQQRHLDELSALRGRGTSRQKQR